MIERINGNRLGLVDDGGIKRYPTLRAIQRGELFVYAILTRDGAIKIGSTTDLATRKRGIGLGGTKKIMAFRPGDLRMERSIQRAVQEFLIPGTREYYYPLKPVLAEANRMREYWGIEPLPNRYLPRLSQCKFHGRVGSAQTTGTSVFS